MTKCGKESERFKTSNKGSDDEKEKGINLSELTIK